MLAVTFSCGELAQPDAEGFDFASTAAPGGADRDRTDDPLLAKQVLSQLSYSPGRFENSEECRMLNVECSMTGSPFNIQHSAFNIREALGGPR